MVDSLTCFEGRFDILTKQDKYQIHQQRRFLKMTSFLVLFSIVLAGLLAIAAYFYFKSREDIQFLNSELERFDGIRDLESYRDKIQQQLKEAKQILPPFESLAELERYRIDLQATIEQTQRTERAWQERIAGQEVVYNSLIMKTAEVEDQLELQSFAFYQTKYGFEDSEQYKHEIKRIRTQQKTLIKKKTATHCSQEWLVEGDAKKGARMIAEHSKLMLRAFNGECDSAISSVKYSNVDRMEKRIQRAFDQVNKLGESKKLFITNAYLKMKLQELYLVYEHRDQLNAEREEQRRIKEQMREEERARREIEKAQKKAEEEEKAKEFALQRARLELENAHDTERAKLNELVAKLEGELQEALANKERAIARAQQTRSGHVYVISNVGVFGEGVYKIGMTRRLEPLDRVKELGDASVPFPFDVHAMIYSEDAPSLENELHRKFANKRLNLINLRREFFRVGINEVQAEVAKEYPDASFISFAEAEEFRRSNALREQIDAGYDLADLLAVDSA